MDGLDNFVTDRELTTLQETGRIWLSRPMTVGALAVAIDTLGLNAHEVRVVPGGATMLGLHIVRREADAE